MNVAAVARSGRPLLLMMLLLVATVALAVLVVVFLVRDSVCFRIPGSREDCPLPLAGKLPLIPRFT